MYIYIYVYITLWLWLRYAAQSDSLSAFITIDLQVQNTDHDFHGDRMRPECHPHVGNLHLCLDFTKPIKAIWKFDENGIIYIYSFYMILQTSTLSFSSSQTNKSQEVLTRRINQESEVLLGCELGNPKWLTHVNNCMSWVCPSSIHFHSVPRQGSGTGYGRGVSQWRWKHNRGAVGQNRISFGKWQSVSIRFLGVSENGVCHQITVATTYIYILYIYIPFISPHTINILPFWWGYWWFLSLGRALELRNLGRNVLNREVAKDGDTANMPRPAAVEALKKWEDWWSHHAYILSYIMFRLYQIII